MCIFLLPVKVHVLALNVVIDIIFIDMIRGKKNKLYFDRDRTNFV